MHQENKKMSAVSSFSSSSNSAAPNAPPTITSDGSVGPTYREEWLSRGRTVHMIMRRYQPLDDARQRAAAVVAMSALPLPICNRIFTPYHCFLNTIKGKRQIVYTVRSNASRLLHLIPKHGCTGACEVMRRPLPADERGRTYGRLKLGGRKILGLHNKRRFSGLF